MPTSIPLGSASPWLLVALIPVALAFVVAGLRDPVRVALPAYAVVVPFGSGITVFGRGFGSLSSIVGIVLAAGLLFQLATVRRASARIPATVPLWLALLALTGITIFWSLRPQATAAGFMSFASLVLLYAVIAVTRVDRAELTRFENALLLGGVASSCYGIAQLLFFGGLPVSEAGSVRFGNDLLGPNNQAAALLLPLAIALGRLVTRERQRRLLHLGVIGVLLTGIVMTGSRGGLVALVVALAVSIMASRQGRGLLIGYSVAGTLFVAALVVSQPGGIGERTLEKSTETLHSASSGRSEIWSIALYSCETYCLTGAGWQMFPTVYAQSQSYVPDAQVLPSGATREAHNIWILVVIELGLAGFVLLLLALGTTVVSAFNLPDHLRGPPLAAVAGTVVASFFLSNLEYKFWWIALIYAVVCHNCSSDNYSDAEPSTSQKVAPA